MSEWKGYDDWSVMGVCTVSTVGVVTGCMVCVGEYCAG